MPAPTTETLPISGSSEIERMPTSAMIGSSAARASRRSVRGTVNDMCASAPSSSGSSWMIMSTLMFASASAVKMRPDDARMVRDAEQRRVAPRHGNA